jgi:hypothetical protein
VVEEYPRNLTELEASFSTEESCRAYLARLRWPTGFCCRRCGGGRSWPAYTTATPLTVKQSTRLMRINSLDGSYALS